MTAQAPDLFRLDGEDYAIAGISGAPLFDPDDHGLVTPMTSTGCWRGHVCTYALAADRLVLAELLVGAHATLRGAPIRPGTALFGGAAADPPVNEYERHFRDLAFPVAFTGGLLLGADFVPSTYVHMGYTPAWKYARVVELTFDNGVLTARRDRSEEFARTRADIEAGQREDPDGTRGGPGWVARTFGLGYDRSGTRPTPPPGV